ncbi:MAG: hypothetical protein HUK22_07215 [Thermoguttaceae bacterium]|nr:hypothetical protein [Thermoguttaceae bacterium]
MTNEEFKARVMDVADGLIELLFRKADDYGVEQIFEPPILAPGLTPRQAILARASDKIKRFETLSKKGAANFETVEDTVRDLAGYCILWLANESGGDDGRS